MAINNYLNRMERIDELIRRQATGSPEELAYKLGICRRRVYDYIDEMRDLGAPIEYNKSAHSFIYTQNGSLIITFQANENKI